MSDESDSSDSEKIVVHNLPGDHKVCRYVVFHACHTLLLTELNLWMKELDKRYKMKLDRNNTKTPLKERVLGPASSSSPPSGAPN